MTDPEVRAAVLEYLHQVSDRPLAGKYRFLATNCGVKPLFSPLVEDALRQGMGQHGWWDDVLQVDDTWVQFHQRPRFAEMRRLVKTIRRRAARAVGSIAWRLTLPEERYRDDYDD